jgi:hypothetical protein
MVSSKEERISIKMENNDSSSIFENISQRALDSYHKQLSAFSEFIPDHLPPDQKHGLQVSQRELYNFFLDFYQYAFNHAEIFGLPVKPDVFMQPGFTKEEKQAVSKQFKKPRVTMEYGIDFLLLTGEKGQLGDGNLILDSQDYTGFFVKNPRVKHKFLQGLQQVGLTITEQEKAISVSNPHYPYMMPALKTLAEACAKINDDRLGKFLFSRCDFRILDADYRPDVLDILQHVTSPHAYTTIKALNHTLGEMSYVPTLNIGSIHDWRIQYQGNRKIKSTPFFEFEYDERQQDQLVSRIKCASTNRLVPLLKDQPVELQRDFFHHAHSCAGDSCGWCATRKTLGPSVIEYDGEKRTICWWMQRHFKYFNTEVVNLVTQYAQFHEALLTA